MRNSPPRMLFKAATGALWLFVAWLTVGLAETFYLDKYIPKHNPYILAEKNNGPRPTSPMPGFPTTPVIMPPVVQWQEAKIGEVQAADWETAAGTAAGIEALSSVFPNLSEEERTRFAIAHALTALLLDKEERLLRVYGNWFNRTLILGGQDDLLPEAIGATARKVAGGGSAATIALPLNGSEDLNKTVDCHFVPEHENVYMFANLQYAYLVARAGPPPPGDYRWKINGLSYKTGFRGCPSFPGFFTNRYGFRAPDISVPKPSGVFRIVCIGGSTTVEGSDNESTYPALVERHLREFFPGKQIEVLNCGVEGITTRNQFLHLSTFLELQPDLILAYEGVNDIGIDLADTRIWEPPLAFSLLPKFVQRRSASLVWPSEEIVREWMRELTVANLESLRRVAARKGIRLALCSIAYPEYDALPKEQQQFYDSKCNYTARKYAMFMRILNDEIRRYCADRRVLYIPVAENVSPTIEYLYDICHMRPSGIERKAAIISEVLRDYIAPAISTTSSRAGDR